jgi:hypothetical protein
MHYTSSLSLWHVAQYLGPTAVDGWFMFGASFLLLDVLHVPPVMRFEALLAGLAHSHQIEFVCRLLGFQV